METEEERHSVMKVRIGRQRLPTHTPLLQRPQMQVSLDISMYCTRIKERFQCFILQNEERVSKYAKYARNRPNNRF